MEETIKRLHDLGLEWGHGDSRNPDQIKEGVNMMHTNATVAWYKWKGVWREYYPHRGILYLIDDFSCCETEEDIEEIIDYFDKKYGDCV